ncbi:hypothetical protein NEIELOOT_02830 [Neisseria elongata subsp. glycolytica ATCC 29315]|uniref:Uncharacterized protein n=1 Tax=Neisseria elongata subsp. glycolytica ATCC 29315 TaxID=546263 RepID=D4DUN5_NEIEG|nr:hypothetical protein NEIELOOT_02830 [Neisseria elongata subsp. glycolytica ATCC 29315]
MSAIGKSEYHPIKRPSESLFRLVGTWFSDGLLYFFGYRLQEWKRGRSCDFRLEGIRQCRDARPIANANKGLVISILHACAGMRRFGVFHVDSRQKAAIKRPSESMASCMERLSDGLCR